MSGTAVITYLTTDAPTRHQPEGAEKPERAEEPDERATAPKASPAGPEAPAQRAKRD